MKPLEIIRRPKRCPRCGGEVCDILYGLPPATWKEDYLASTGRKAILGGCCIYEGMPDYECEDCGLQFRKLTFPRNAKQLAMQALEKSDYDIFSDVEYEGLYRDKMVYSPVPHNAICWDGHVLVFVDEMGTTQVRTGVKVIPILQKTQQKKQRLSSHDERFYWYAAKRAIKDEWYYKTVHKCGWYQGKRAYQPIFKDEYQEEPPCIGMPLVILVDDKGRAEYIREALTFDIYNEIREKSKKRKKSR